ncbi:Alpha/Beta hydrolase protein [Coniochaeta sp. 2T2.1]|nr:Alpha/Beta hydrolase protein [Coniochaeta sp. 2T2.1]
MLPLLTALLALGGQATAACTPRNKNYSNSNSSLTLLYQNNLNLTDDANHISAILLDSTPLSAAQSACAALGEALLPRAAVEAHASDVYWSLSYVAFKGRAQSNQWLIANGTTVTLGSTQGQLTFLSTGTNTDTKLPVLCTQSDTSNTFNNAKATATNQIKVPAGGNNYVGYRNQKSFRFQGIRFAPQPKRFEYSVPYAPKGLTIDATKNGPQCMQPYSGGSEDCLFLNIQTPYIPRAGRAEDLRPVHFWIHGGGFTGGNGATDNMDGGNMASREDIVTVEVQYRLSTLGFLAVPGTNVTGNYGLQDQNLALKWVVANIASFGGDPNRITINGGSAGAASVRVLLGSPKSIGLFHGAIAMSNLGGGFSLGIQGDYATQYSAYPTIEGSYQLSRDLFGQAGCNQTNLDAAIACLKGVDGSTLVSLPTVARYIVQDGVYVTTPQLEVKGRSDKTAYVPVIFGIARDDGSSFCKVPQNPSSEREGIQQSLQISAAYAQSVVDSGLFPYHDTGNVTLDSFNVSQRISTDIQFRCIDQASAYAGATTGAFPAAWYYEADRTGYGYDPNGLGGPPATPGYPLGNPNLPYFRTHGSDQNWAFEWPFLVRDAADLYSIQLSGALYSNFIREGQPNPSDAWLAARGYETVRQGIKAAGEWPAIKSKEGPIRHLDWPGLNSPFVDVEQCKWLNYSIEYYLA